MAISITQTTLPFTTNHFKTTFCFEKQFLATLPTQKAHSVKLLSRTNVVSRANEQQPSSLLDLDFEAVNKNENKSVEKNDLEKPNLAESWRKILGEGDWKNMLDPMDPLLRSELIRYGEMVQSCYDGFDYEPFSKYCGSCRFPRSEFFERVGLENCGYDISRYLYATSNLKVPKFFIKTRWPKVWCKNADWIGYIAVSNDEMSQRLGRRDIAIAWRGTVTKLEWVEDLMDFLRPSDKIPSPDKTVKIESGFLDLYTDKDESCPFSRYSAREQTLAELNRLLEKYSDEEVSITIMGHSLGSALAVLNGYDIVETGVNKLGGSRVVPVCVFSFSGPRVGNPSFKERVELLGLKVLRVLNVHDIVPKSPGFFFNENLPSWVLKMVERLPWTYSHVGIELVLDHKNSPFLNHDADEFCAHNLEAHLHLVDGYHGSGHQFVSATRRDPALVNKSCDFLKDEYTVPPSWIQDKNKGLLKMEDGTWVLRERPIVDDHPDDINYHLAKLGLTSDQ